MLTLDRRNTAWTPSAGATIWSPSRRAGDTRQRHQVRQGLARDAVVLQLAAADRHRAERAARAGAPYGGTKALVIQDRFFAGGANTVRGYREDRLGPLDANGNPTGGNATAIGNLEVRFPIWRWFGGAVFVDTGAVTPEIKDLHVRARSRRASEARSGSRRRSGRSASTSATRSIPSPETRGSSGT